MSEWKTYRISVGDGFDRYITERTPPVAGDFDHDCNEIMSVEEVEIRPLHREGCEWEKSPCGEYGTTGDWCRFQCYECCPMCGRRLE